MPSSHKKVILRRTSGEMLAGYLPANGFVRPVQEDGDGRSLDLLDLSGHVRTMALDEVKMVSFVRDFNLGDTSNPERLMRRSFLARPRGEGLWIRLTFQSGDLLEGLAPLDASFADDLILDSGFHLLPPDTRSNTQRIYVPRIACAAVELLAVVTAPSRRKERPPKHSGVSGQNELFADGEDQERRTPSET